MNIMQYYVDKINSIFNRANAPMEGLLLPPRGELDLIPSQSDKPSPHSSLSRTKILSLLAYDFNSRTGFSVHRVANTNSMEPLFDDNSLVILEILEGKWRDLRLRLQPFVEGDVVIYKTTRGNIIHVLNTQTTFLGKKAWIIKGTNNKLPDMQKVPESAITHRLVGIMYGRQVRPGD